MARYAINKEILQKAIDIAGGISALAEKSQLSYQSIIDWRNGRKSPSSESCVKIEKATKGAVNRREILPDFPWAEIE